jgi:hypothetical protein
MEQSPSWEAKTSWATQEIPRILWNPIFYAVLSELYVKFQFAPYRGHKSSFTVDTSREVTHIYLRIIRNIRINSLESKMRMFTVLQHMGHITGREGPGGE